jgi:hypothetical protein
MQYFFPPARGVAGFFPQFTFCGFECVLAFINSSRREFVKKSPGCMAILPLDKNPRFAAAFINGQNNDGSRVSDYISADANPGRFEDVVGRYPEYRAAICNS